MSGRRVLIVDDHPIVRSGLAMLLSAQPDFSEVDQASNGDEALRAIERSRPDVAIIDLTLGAESGLDVIRRLHAVDSTLPVLVVSMHDESLHAERALKAGAHGYVMKHEATEQVVDAVQRLLRGELAFSAAVQQRFLGRIAKRGPSNGSKGNGRLSSREVEVLQLIGLGYSTAQIAERLGRSVKTVETHRSAIKTKLELASTFELIRYASRFADGSAHDALSK